MSETVDVITLYEKIGTRSNRARWVLQEGGFEADYKELDFMKGEQKKPEYLKIHPLGRVPAFTVGNRSFFESAAIVMHFADLSVGLSPPNGSEERMEYYQWIVFGPAEIDAKLSTLTVHTLFFPPEQRDKNAARVALEGWTNVAEVINNVLSDRDYILGHEFSAADIVIGHDVAWAKMLNVLDDFPDLVSYLNRLEQRSAFKSVYGEKVRVYPDPYAK